MIALDIAVKNRWDATNMAAYVANGPFFQQPPEQYQGDFPYCIYSYVSHVQFGRTKASRYKDKQVQFQVYGTDQIAVGYAMDAIVEKFLSSERAQTSPLTATGLTIIDTRIVGDPMLDQESDGVFKGTVVLGIEYAGDSGLTPG